MQKQQPEDDSEEFSPEPAWSYEDWFERMGQRPQFLETALRRPQALPSFSFMAG